MGTFHSGKSELHGITVVVDTKGAKVFVGRCEDMDEATVILLDADEHEDGTGGKSKQQYVERAAKFGVWKKHEKLVIPRAEVASVHRLGEVFQAVHSGTVANAVRPAEPVAAQPVPSPAASKDAHTIVTLTPKAQDEVRRLLGDEKPGAGLRLSVKGGGCSGLVYKLEFDMKKVGDVDIPYAGFSLFMDKKSTIYLRGITLDHQKGLQGKGFVFHNPNASNTCGCGESFSV